MRYVGTAATVMLALLASLLCFSVNWAFSTWANLTIEELVYHLNAPLEGTNQDIIKEYLNLCLAPALLIVFLLLVLFAAWRKRKRYYVLMGAGAMVSVVIAAITLYSGWNRLDVGSYVQVQDTESDFIEEHYIDPAEADIIFPEEKKNLIYIFLESMEVTYADEANGGAFEENVIRELTDIAQENEDFSGPGDELNGAFAMSGTTWTMGAMFAHTSGLPLNVSIDGNDMDTQETFSPVL